MVASLAAGGATLIALTAGAAPVLACMPGDPGCLGGKFSLDKYLYDKGSQGDIYALTQWQQRQTEQFVSQQTQQRYVPPRPSYQSVTINSQGQTVVDAASDPSVQGDAKHQQYLKDLAEWQEKYGANASVGSTGGYAAPRQWYDTSGFVVPINVNTPGISELWPRIFTQSRPYPDGPIIPAKIKEFAVWALPRALYDAGSPMGVIVATDNLRCTHQYCHEEGEQVLDTLVSLANQLALELQAPANNLTELEPYIDEALNAKDGDVRSAMDYVIYNSPWDFLIRARVINQLQRRESGLASLRALKERRSVGAQVVDTAREVHASVSQEPTPYGARLKLAVKSKMKPGSTCRVTVMTWDEAGGRFVKMNGRPSKTDAKRACRTTIEAKYGDVIEVAGMKGPVLTRIEMPS